MKKTVCILALWVLAAAAVQAKVELPPVLSDNMVLQQKQEVALWGKATGKKVTITATWTKKKTVVRPEADGNWFVRIPTPAAGGPYEITFNDGEKLTLKNVLIGEVWYCGGQSNMDMPVKGFEAQPVEHSTEYILRAKPSVPIRICKVPNTKSKTPLPKVEAFWVENKPEEVMNASATGYFFAQKLYEMLEVPIGIITVDWGGSSIESWMSRELLEREFPGEFDTALLDTAPLEDLKGSRHPCILYNGMVEGLAPFTFKGMIWYQGETNRGRWEQYTRLQPAYVKMMRELFQNPDAPFYFVQIAPYTYQPQYKDLFTSGYFCEAQEKTLALIPHSGMVTTTDIGSYSTIHPPKKLEVGNRLAYLALVKDYGFKGINPVAPTYKSVEFSGEEAIVTFEVDRLGIGPMNTDLGGFELAGEDRVFHPAIGRLKNKKVVVTSPEVPAPVALRYCFRNWCVGSVFSAWGIPAGPFRTDDWDDLRQ
jgi:sialate O-acetylesterase